MTVVLALARLGSPESDGLLFEGRGLFVDFFVMI